MIFYSEPNVPNMIPCKHLKWVTFSDKTRTPTIIYPINRASKKAVSSRKYSAPTRTCMTTYYVGHGKCNTGCVTPTQTVWHWFEHTLVFTQRRWQSNCTSPKNAYFTPHTPPEMFTSTTTATQRISYDSRPADRNDRAKSWVTLSTSAGCTAFVAAGRWLASSESESSVAVTQPSSTTQETACVEGALFVLVGSLTVSLKAGSPRQARLSLSSV